MVTGYYSSRTYKYETMVRHPSRMNPATLRIEDAVITKKKRKYVKPVFLVISNDHVSFGRRRYCLPRSGTWNATLLTNTLDFEESQIV